MSSKYVPVDADAEASVLAVLLTAPATFDDVADVLHPEDFGVSAHEEVYRAICACDDSGRPFDQVTVADELRRSKMLDRAGGVAFLEQLVDWAPGAGNIVAHAEIVAEKSKLRRLASAGREISSAALVPDADAQSTLEMAETTVFELGATRAPSTLIPMSEAVAGALSALANRPTGALLGHSTGFSDLDRLTSGFQSGQLIVVAARPAMGKSAFALQLAAHIAATSGLAVPFLSYEMSVDELTVRLLSSYMQFDSARLRRGDLVSGMDEELAKAAERARELPLLIDDQPPETISGVRSAMRRLHRRQPLGAVVIDYMQLMRSDRNYRDPNRVQEVSDVSRGLKRLADDLKCPVIALSQLSRNLEGRPNKRPMLSDLRESGSIEQDASVVLFLYNDHTYHPDSPISDAELLLAKQRSGVANVRIPLQWEPTWTTFSDSDRHLDELDAGGGFPAPPAGRGGNYAF